MQPLPMHRWGQWFMVCLLALGLWCSQISQATAAAITDALPHGEDGLAAGAQVCVGVQFFPNPVFGQGTLTELTPYHAIARGTYDLNRVGFGLQGQGEWAVNLNSEDDGAHYQVVVDVTGNFNEHQQFTGTSAATGAPTKCQATIVYTNPDKPTETLTQTCQEKGFLKPAKLFLRADSIDVPVIGHPTLFLRRRTDGNC